MGGGMIYPGQGGLCSPSISYRNGRKVNVLQTSLAYYKCVVITLIQVFGLLKYQILIFMAYIHHPGDLDN